MIAKLFDKIKSYQYPVFLAICLVLISFISYNLGKVNALTKSPLKISGGNSNAADSGLKADIYSATGAEGASDLTMQKKLDTRVVASKASTSKKYHYTWCPGGKKIKPENQLWFNSDKEAEASGYSLAGNCTK